MEANPHSNRKHAVPGQVSRMEDDLRRCSEDFESSFRARAPGRHRASKSSAGKERPIRVCVVGAGLSGLRCAEVLAQANVEVTVLEARGRIGGRVHQDNLLDVLVDMGPNWVHGTENNPIVRLANEANTSLKALGENSRVFGLVGKPVTDQRLAEYHEVFWDVVAEAFKTSNRDCANIRPEKSLKEFFKEMLPSSGLDDDEQLQVLHMAEMWGSFIGDEWDLQSLKWFWLEECLDGENLFVINTHAGVVDRIAKTVDQRADLHLSRKVIQIENIGHPRDDPRVLVTVQRAAQQHTFEFDEVIVTAPLGFLKRGALHFEPSLPSSICQAIQHASISSYEKAYIAFPAAFWESPSADPDSDKKHFPAFALFLSGAGEDEGSRSLSLELNPLSSPEIFGEHAQPILLFNLFGHSAEQMTTTTRGLSAGTEQYLQALTQFFRPYYSQLPNYSPDRQECVPKAVLATNWQNDDLAGNGSYTNFKISSKADGEIFLDQDVEVLRKGLPERGVWFAGEHTAPFVALGTSTGAYWSGESVAMRVLAINGLVEARETA